MSEPYIAEIQVFVGDYAPRGWAFCDGRILQVRDNPALFSLIGDTYGGDGRTTFGLPDLRGRVAIGVGNPPGRTPVLPGQMGGTETVNLQPQEMTTHTHQAVSALAVSVQATTEQGSVVSPAGGAVLCTGYDLETTFQVDNYVASPAGTTVELGGTEVQGAVAVQSTGGSKAHENMMPWQSINYIIALEGIFPQRP